MKKRFFVLAIALCLALSSFGQLEYRPASVDSLKNSFITMFNAGEQEGPLAEMAKNIFLAVRPAPLQTGTGVFHQLLSRMDRKGTSYLQSAMQYFLGNLYANHGLNDKSLEAYLEAYKILMKDPGSQGSKAYILVDIGNRLFANGFYELAERLYRRAYVSFVDITVTLGQYTSLNNIGLCHQENLRYDSAMYYFQLADKIRAAHPETSSSLFLKGHSLVYIASIYVFQSRLDSAIRCLNQSVELILADSVKINIWDRQRTYANALYLLGRCYEGKGQYPQMQGYFNKSGNAARQSGALKIIFDINKDLCIHYFNLGDYLLAKQNAIRAMELADSAFLQNEKAEVMYYLSRIALKMSDIPLANTYIHQYKLLTEGMMSQQSNRKLQEINASIESINADIEKGRLLSKQKLFRAWLISVSILLLAFLIFWAVQANLRRKNEARFKLLSNSTFEGILIHVNGRIMDCNEKLTQMLDLPAQEIIGKRVLDFVPAEDHERVAETDENGNQHSYVIRVLRADNSTMPVEVMSRYYVYQGFQARVAAIRDLTESVMARQRIQESEEKYRLLADNLKDILWQIDLDMTMVYLSPSVVTMLGYQVEEVLGENLTAYLSEPSLRLLAINKDYIKEKVSEGKLDQQFTFQLEIRHAEGRYIWCESYVTPLINQQGQIYRYQGVTHDISLRKQLELSLHEQQRLLSTLMKNLPGIAYRCRNDRDWTMEFVSDGCLHLTGYPAEALINNKQLSFNELVLPKYRDQLWEIWQGVLSEKRGFEEEYEIMTADGSTKWVWEKGCGVFDESGQLLALEGFITDITSKREYEEAIKKKNRELEEANVTKSKFFSIIGHDLKNPLHAILGFSELLHEDYEQYDEVERKRFVAGIREVALNLQKLLQNLLEWASVQSGKMEFRPETAYLNLLVRDVVGLLKEQAMAKQVVLRNEVQPNQQAQLDKDMISTVLRNLLTNAIKFSNPGNTVRITCDALAGKVQIGIIDEGVGIQPDDLARLFDITQKVKRDGTAAEKGTGLGLVICKEFVEKHGGTIEARNNPGKGSTFLVTLPT